MRENCKKISKRMHRFKREKEMTEKYKYCSTVARTFVQDCGFMKSSTVYEASLRTFVRFEPMI